MANITLTDEVAEILSRSTITGNKLVLPPGRLDRKTYEAVNKAIVIAGGKWNTGAQAHIFNGDPRAKLGLILETGVVVDEKKKYQSFFTPPGLAARVAALASVQDKIVLEPSAGHGALADACLTSGATRVECVELNPESCSKLREKEYPTWEGDFLALPPKPYQRIVMNPPFTKNQDVKHVAHAVKFLAPGGVLVAIMSPNTARPQFKTLVGGRAHYIEEVDPGAFKESGTPIATIILRIHSENNKGQR